MAHGTEEGRIQIKCTYASRTLVMRLTACETCVAWQQEQLMRVVIGNGLNWPTVMAVHPWRIRLLPLLRLYMPDRQCGRKYSVV